MPLPTKFRMAIQVDYLPVPLNTPMGGYGWGHDRRFTGRTANPLKIRCLIIVSPQGQRIVLLQIDVISIPRPVYQDILSRLQGAGVVSQAKDFVLAQSHTHAGPMVGDKPDPYVLLGSQDAADVTKRYTTDFVNAVVDTAVRAHRQGLTEVTLGYAEGFAEIGRNRIEPPLPYAPREVPVLVARRTDSTRNLFAVLVGHACHPVCSPHLGETLDADYCGFAVDEVEKRLGVPAVFFQGAAGDINPDPQDTTIAALRLTNAIVATVRNAAYFPIYGPITTSIDTVQLPYAVDLGNAGELAALKQRYQDRVYENGNAAGVRHAERMIAEIDRGNVPTRMPMTIQKIDLGGLTILTMSHEVLSGYHVGTKAKWVARNPLQPLWIMAYANHIDCYVPAYDLLSTGGAAESGWKDGDPKTVGVDTYGQSYSMVSPLAAGTSMNDPNGVEGALVPRIAGLLGLT